MLNSSYTDMNIARLTAYTIYLVEAMGYKCSVPSQLKFEEANFRPQSVERYLKGWVTKLTEEFGIKSGPNAQPTINRTFQDDGNLSEEKAPILAC